MRDDTARWLEPLMDAANEGAVREAMREATMPASEADHPTIDALSGVAPDDPNIAHGAIDWVRCGQLLRQRLGWHHYPESPPSTN